MRLFERLFLLHTFARFREPAASAPPLRRHPFFVQFFARFQHPARPICRAAVPIWNPGPFLGPPKFPNWQQARHSPAVGDSFRVSDMPDSGQQASFLVRIFSDYPQSGKSVFLFCFSLRFCIRAAVLFLCDFSRLFQITGPLLHFPACWETCLICPACVPAVYAEILGFFRVLPAARPVHIYG